MGYLLFFIQIMAISLFAEGIVQIDKIQALGDVNPSFEEIIKANVRKEKSPFVFQLDSKTISPEFLSEIYYVSNKNLPPDVYIATFHPEKKYLIDLIMEKSILELPPEIEIVKADWAVAAGAA